MNNKYKNNKIEEQHIKSLLEYTSAILGHLPIGVIPKDEKHNPEYLYKNKFMENITNTDSIHIERINNKKTKFRRFYFCRNKIER